MADTKITGLTALAVPEGADLLAIVDDPSGTPATKKATLSNVRLKPFYATVGATNSDYITDGTADEVQIQAAIDACTAASGGVVRIKAGTYTLTNDASASIIMKSNVELVGEGVNKTIIVAGGDTELSNNSRSVGVITTASPGFPAATTDKDDFINMAVRDMTVKPRNGGIGVSFFNSSHVKIENVEEYSTNIGGSPLIKAGILTLHCQYVWINGCYVHDTHGNGININSVDNFWVTNNRVEDTYDDGIDVDFDFGESNAVYSNYGVVSGNTVDGISESGACIRVENSHYVVVADNPYLSAGSPTAAGDGIWIGCYDEDNKTCTNITVVNNNVHDCQNVGIKTECTDNATGATVANIIIANNNIYDCGDNAGADVRGGIVHSAQVLSGSRVLIQGNRIHTVAKTTDSGGIVIYKQGRVVVKNNLVEAAPYGIHLWNGSGTETYTDVFVEDNNVHATTTNYFGASSSYTQAGVRLDLGGVIGTGNAIRDENGNEQIKFATTASAINEFTVTNAASGSGPTLSATGGGTDIDINLTPKGTGNLNINGDILFAQARDIQFNSGGTLVIKGGSTSSNISFTGWNGSVDYPFLYLKSDGSVGISNNTPSAKLHIGTAGTYGATMKLDGSTSGTITIQPAAAAGTWTWTLPTDDGDANQVLTTNGSGVTSWTNVLDTREISLFQGAMLDTTGDAFFEPYTILATNDKFGHAILRLGANNAAAPTVKSGFYGRVHIPADYNAGTVTLTVYWSTTLTSGDAVFDFDYRAIGGNDTESLDQATYQESLTVTDTAGSATNERMTIDLTVTAANLAADDTLEFFFGRDGADAADTLAGSALIHELILKYSALA